MDFHYRRLANDLRARILSGAFQPGERMPSIRSLHQRLRLSISTVYQAYVDLEAAGLIEARPRSGYFVKPAGAFREMPAPATARPSPEPRTVDMGGMVNAILAAIADPDILPLGSSATAPELLPIRHIGRILRELSGPDLCRRLSYGLTEGLPELRRLIALQTLGAIPGLGPEDLVITTGCAEAVSLCVQALARPGDTVAIESPTHFGFLQMFTELGIRVAEIPVHPKTGLDLDGLERLVSRHSVKAVLVQPGFQNPTGARMPDDAKERLAGLAARFRVPVIEDDICGDMFFEGHRPLPLRAFERTGRDRWVFHCGSFSKTVAPGLRIGWIAPPKEFRDALLRLKAGLSVCGSTLAQHVMARFLRDGGYERHMRSLRAALQRQVLRTALAVRRFFPAGTRLALPEGGSLLWVQLPDGRDGLTLYRRALERRISILPGVVCGVSGDYAEYIRLGCGHPFTDKTEAGIQTLGELAAIKD